MERLELSVWDGRELPIHDDVANMFSNSLVEAISENRFGYHVVPRGPKTFKSNAVLIGLESKLEKDKLLAGVAVMGGRTDENGNNVGGFITSLFKHQERAENENVSNVMSPLIKTAIDFGGTTIGCFGDKLIKSYMSMGFVPISVSPVPNSWIARRHEERQDEDFVSLFVRPLDAPYNFNSINEANQDMSIFQKLPYIEDLGVALNFMSIVENSIGHFGYEQMLEFVNQGGLCDIKEQFASQLDTECTFLDASQTK